MFKALITCTAFAALCGAADRPNVLFIAVDDLRPELGCYGVDRAQTPHIDALAAGGLLLERAYCNVPVCGASRASVLTGLRPTAQRFTSYQTRAEKDAPGITPLPAHFQAHGYTALSYGKVFHHRNDHRDAWSLPPGAPGGPWAGPGYHRDENRRERGWYTAASIEFTEQPDEHFPDGATAAWAEAELENLAAAEKPFFLAVGFVKPHLPFTAPARYAEAHPLESVSLPANDHPPEGCPAAALHNWGELRSYQDIPRTGPVDEAKARELIRGYLACTSYVDAQIGRVLAALEAQGLADDTIVVLWGDHGYQLLEHGLWCKHSSFETSMQIPLILRVPGRTGGERSAALVESVDLYPTLCALAGLPVPEHCDGLDLQPLLEDQDHELRAVAYGRFAMGDTLRSDRYRYTVFHADRGQGDQMLGEMLYDHHADPEETVNLIDDPAHAEAAADLRARSAAIRAGW
jgi:iduronate 2-sulfatase